MEHIKSHLEGLAAGLLRGLNEEDRVMAAWPHVCGQQAAEHARAVGYSRGVLLLDVDEGEWLRTLQAVAGGVLCADTGADGGGGEGFRLF